jgi:uncharacterized protein YecE (DUF72 family)
VKGRVFIGTSGWSYTHWRGPFYPAELKPHEWFKFYARNFETVEINNTFYGLPSEGVFSGWREAAPRGFTYALKASRFITHVKKLKDPEGPLKNFFDRAGLLKECQGPVLFQLPPRWGLNLERLEEFLSLLPVGVKSVFEFRDRSWLSEDVYNLLKDKGIALCIYDMPGFTSPAVLTSGFTYIRFHGTGTLYGGRYTEGELKGWAERVKGYIKEGIDVYAYFNNDAQGNAVINARELRGMVGG